MIFCYGDINIDYLINVPAIPREDEELPINNYEVQQGGSAANTAVGLARLDQPVVLLGSVGSSEERILNGLAQEKVNISLLHKTGQTGTTFILIDHSANRRILTSRGANDACSLTFLDEDLFAQCSHFHISSPCQSFLETFPFARFPSIKFSLDAGSLTSSSSPQLLWGVLPFMDLFFINMVEAELLFPQIPMSEGLIRGLGCRAVIHKKGAQGSDIWTVFNHWRIPAFSVDVVDTTGAGDAYAAGFLSQYVKKKPLAECALFATAAGALNTLQCGAQKGMPNGQQVRQFLKKQKEKA